MQFLVVFEVFESVVDPALNARARGVVAAQIKELLATAKVTASAPFAARRGGFFVLEGASGEELQRMLGPMLECGEFTVYPLSSWEALMQLFAKIA